MPVALMFAGMLVKSMIKFLTCRQKMFVEPNCRPFTPYWSPSITSKPVKFVVAFKVGGQLALPMIWV